ncbi:Gcv operon activator [Providencia stuartii]|nr:Gcv operon activator [Providencia stuartii]
MSKNAFYLVCQENQADLGKIAAFRQWILTQAASEQEKLGFITGDQDMALIQ